MLENLIIVAGQVGTLFLLMGVGFFLAKREMLAQQTVSQMSSILLYISAPCIMVDSMQIDRDWQVLKIIGIAAVAAIIYYVVAALVSQRLWRKQEADERDVLRAGALFPNCGFMGIPLVSAVFGELGKIYFLPVLAIFNIAQWTLGVGLMGGRKEVTVKKAFLNPGVIGVAIALALYCLQIHLPGPIGDTVSFLGSLNTPLAMLVIGAQMARADFKATFRRLDLYLLSICKLLVFPLLTLLLCLPLGLPKVVMGVVIVLSACPTAGTTGIFAQKFGRGMETAAQSITLTTLLSMIALPLWAVAFQ